MKKITLNMIHDPGHAWLRVPNTLVREVDRINGVADRVSCYSFITDDWSYLEEDLDAEIFLKAALDAGIAIHIGAPSFANRTAQCRQYPAFTAARSRLEIRAGSRYFCGTIAGGSFVHLVGFPGDIGNKGRYVVTTPSDGVRYGVKPKEFHAVLKSDVYGECLLARRKAAPFLVGPGPGATQYGQEMLGKLFSTFDQAGGVSATVGALARVWPASFVRIGRFHETGAPPGLTADMDEWVLSNVAVAALQMEAWARAVDSRQAGAMGAKRDSVMASDSSMGDFLGLLSQRAAVPPKHDLDLKGPFVVDASGGVLFLTRAESRDGSLQFEVRRLAGSPHAEGAMSSLVATAQVRDDAVKALYRRVAQDVLEDPATLARLDLGHADRQGVEEQVRGLAGESADSHLLSEDVASPMASDDDAADMIMI